MNERWQWAGGERREDRKGLAQVSRGWVLFIATFPHLHYRWRCSTQVTYKGRFRRHLCPTKEELEPSILLLGFLGPLPFSGPWVRPLAVCFPRPQNGRSNQVPTAMTPKAGALSANAFRHTLTPQVLRPPVFGGRANSYQVSIARAIGPESKEHGEGLKAQVCVCIVLADSAVPRALNRALAHAPTHLALTALRTIVWTQCQRNRVENYLTVLFRRRNN